MNWAIAAMAVGTAYAAALAYYPVRGARGWRRVAAYVAVFVVISATPLLVPLESLVLRFFVGVVAVALAVKVYDLAVEPRVAVTLSGWRYAAWLWNFASVVLRENS